MTTTTAFVPVSAAVAAVLVMLLLVTSSMVTEVTNRPLIRSMLFDVTAVLVVSGVKIAARESCILAYARQAVDPTA